jgi:carbamoyl-phosphate synthase small subunit
MKAKLLLENNLVFTGEAFGTHGETTGEVVFNTSMSGYQEILTDPSYTGQLITMTYPLIGNYGTNDHDVESGKIQAAGFIVKEVSEIASNHESRQTLDAYFKSQGIVGISGIDTRKLVRILRTDGAMRGIISSTDLDEASLLKKVLASPLMAGRDLTGDVTTKTHYVSKSTAVKNESAEYEKHFRKDKAFFERVNAEPFNVVAFDFGIKQNIVRLLNNAGCDVTVVPAATTAEAVLAMKPDGIFLSNGPGDPEAVGYAIETIKRLTNPKEAGREIPTFGICLGHQLLGLAFGGRTYKLKFGHRGGNHPVKNLITGKIEITSQNHGFAIEMKKLPKSLELTHLNLYDDTCEGFRHKKLPVFAVQYHPEASPGPHDSHYLFDEFITLMTKYRN